jgi:predicted nucleotidyltransferase
MNVDVNIFYQRSLKQIKAVVLDALKEEDVMIILFGSAARGDVHRFSDIDIGILPKNNYNKKQLILLREKIENLNIPYTVDLVDISHVSLPFKEKLLSEGEIWKK